jgi:hypothetical protein
VKSKRTIHCCKTFPQFQGKRQGFSEKLSESAGIMEVGVCVSNSKLKV